MGRYYSLSGFVNATYRRSGKTILVEGANEKEVFHRLAADKIINGHKSFLVDDASILKCEETSGRGNKDKVLLVRNKINEMSKIDNKIKEKIASMVDREWDGMKKNSEYGLFEWSEPAQGGNEFSTYGHSIENYNFNIEYVVGYIKYMHASIITKNLFDEIYDNFHKIILLAVVVSHELSKYGCFGKCDRVLDLFSIDRCENFLINASLVEKLKNRGVLIDDAFIKNVNTFIENNCTNILSIERLRWVAHGHVGQDIIWACVGRIALDCGISHDDAVCISRGNKTEKFRFFSEWLSKLPNEKRIPFDDVVDWLVTV